jgi:pimeloyl-ACP methyl ester carboxylesterase
LDCLENWALPLDQPGSRAEVLRLARERVRSCAAFWQSQGVDLSGYTTQENADDVDALREALGYEQVNLYGASYGSHLALATIKRHEAHVARAVIALVEGPDHTLKLPGNVQKHLERLEALVQIDPSLRVAIPSLLELMHTVLERLKSEPITVEVCDEKSREPVQVCLGRFDLEWVTANGLGSREFLAHLPARYAYMARGDFSWLAAEVLKLRRSWIGNVMSYVMDCASGASAERTLRIQREAPETLLGTMMDFPFPEICDTCGNPDLGPAFRAPFTSQVPTLFLSGSLDGRTPPSNAEEVRAGFSHSHHLIVENGAHSDETLEAPGVAETVLDFLQGKPVRLTEAKLPFAFISVAER